jgi:hypothetical protein
VMSLSTTFEGKLICARNSGAKFAGVAPVNLLIAACPRSPDITQPPSKPFRRCGRRAQRGVARRFLFYNSETSATMLNTMIWHSVSDVADTTTLVTHRLANFAATASQQNGRKGR